VQKVAYLFVVAILAAAIAGCSEKPETRAAEDIRAQVDVARRHFLRAAGLMGVSPTDLTPADEQAQVLDALNDAEKVLTEALSTHTDATDAGKAPANSMLGEVRLAMAGYHGILARERTSIVDDLLLQLQSEAARGQALAAVGEALQTLTERTNAPDGDEASARAAAKVLQEQAKARQIAAKQKVDQLRATRNDLTKQIEDAIPATETQRRSAGELRRQNRAAMGTEKLELDEKASAAEAVVEAGEAKISTLQLQAEHNAAQLALAEAELAAVMGQMTALTEFVDSLDSRGEDVKKYRSELAELIAKAEQNLTKLAAELAGKYADASEQFQSALTACEQAARANNQAIRALQDQRRAAADVKNDNPKSPMAPLLDSMASTDRLGGVTARKGDIAFAAGETGRQLLQLQARVAHVADQVAGVCESAGITGPAALNTAASSLKALTDIADRADSDYGAAVDAYNKVAVGMLKGKSVRETKWLYQQAQARALLGRYRLSALRGQGNREYLDGARSYIEGVLTGHEGDPTYLPAQQILEAINAEG